MSPWRSEPQPVQVPALLCEGSAVDGVSCSVGGLARELGSVQRWYGHAPGGPVEQRWDIE